jgi:hypothetical protein
LFSTVANAIAERQRGDDMSEPHVESPEWEDEAARHRVDESIATGPTVPG